MNKFVLFLLIFTIFISACQKISGLDTKKESTEQLSELQMTACDTADDAGTCDTRLAELGIVLKEDCCENLGKCC